MSAHYETIGEVVEIFRGSRCIGFIPNCAFAIGEVLALQKPGATELAVVFTVESMQVNHEWRDSVHAGEPCAILIEPFPAPHAHKGMRVLRQISAGQDMKGQTDSTQDQLTPEEICPCSPSGIHEWGPGFPRSYQLSEDAPDRCKHCGKQKSNLI
jgi:hypothetical protein